MLRLTVWRGRRLSHESLVSSCGFRIPTATLTGVERPIVPLYDRSMPRICARPMLIGENVAGLYAIRLLTRVS